MGPIEVAFGVIAAAGTVYGIVKSIRQRRKVTVSLEARVVFTPVLPGEDRSRMFYEPRVTVHSTDAVTIVDVKFQVVKFSRPRQQYLATTGSVFNRDPELLKYPTAAHGYRLQPEESVTWAYFLSPMEKGMSLRARITLGGGKIVDSNVIDIERDSDEIPDHFYN